MRLFQPMSVAYALISGAQAASALFLGADAASSNPSSALMMGAGDDDPSTLEAGMNPGAGQLASIGIGRDVGKAKMEAKAKVQASMMAPEARAIMSQKSTAASYFQPGLFMNPGAGRLASIGSGSGVDEATTALKAEVQASALGPEVRAGHCKGANDAWFGNEGDVCELGADGGGLNSGGCTCSSAKEPCTFGEEDPECSATGYECVEGANPSVAAYSGRTRPVGTFADCTKEAASEEVAQQLIWRRISDVRSSNLGFHPAGAFSDGAREKIGEGPGDCHWAQEEEAEYKEGDQVSEGTVLFERKARPEGERCGQAGYEQTINSATKTGISPNVSPLLSIGIGNNDVEAKEASFAEEAGTNPGRLASIGIGSDVDEAKKASKAKVQASAMPPKARAGNCEGSNDAPLGIDDVVIGDEGQSFDLACTTLFCSWLLALLVLWKLLFASEAVTRRKASVAKMSILSWKIGHQRMATSRSTPTWRRFAHAAFAVALAACPTLTHCAPDNVGASFDYETVGGSEGGDQFSDDSARDDGAVRDSATSITPLATSLKKLSRGLRGDIDPNEVVAEVHGIAANAQDFLKAQIRSVQDMQRMHENGEGEKLATALKSFIADGRASVDAAKDIKEVTGVPLPAEMDSALDRIPEWEDIPDAQLSKVFEVMPQQLNEIVQHVQESVEMMDDVKSLLRSAQDQFQDAAPNTRGRRLNENVFNHDKFSFGQGSFGPGGGFGGDEKAFNPWSAFGRKHDMQKMFRKARAEAHRRRPDISKYLHFGDDGDMENRRLKADERRRRRLADLPVCSPKCDPDDWSCNCERLATCVNNMTHYDLTLLFVEGYVDTDPTSDDYAGFTSDTVNLNLFDADQDIYDKIKDIQDLAKDSDIADDQSKCSDLLAELHAPCSPWNVSCSDPNVQAYQLSIDDVCEGVDTPTKLHFASIFEELDGYASDDGTETYMTTCGNERVAFESCKDFAKYFDYLYVGRDETEYPYPNPMLPDPSVSVGDADTNAIHFPIGYKFRQTTHGVLDLAFPKAAEVSTSGDDVRSVDDNDDGKAMCMDAGDSNNNVYMVDCQDGNLNQIFFFDWSTYQIRQGKLCLDYDSTSQNVYMNAQCTFGLNQKWRFDTATRELKTFLDNKCLDWDTAGGDNNLYMHDCNGQSNQMFRVPSTWLPDVGTGVLQQVRVIENMNKCLDAGGSDNNVYMHDCQDGNTNQKFDFDASTHQISQTKGGATLCLDYDPTLLSQSVYMQECTLDNNQRWRYDASTNELKTFENNKCLDWFWDEKTLGSNILMRECTEECSGCIGEHYQKFTIPPHWLPAISASSVYSSVMVFHADQIRCMDGGRGVDNVYMTSCGYSNDNQDFYYDASTRQIKNGNLCLDYDEPSDSNRVYMNDCNDGIYQQWYYNVVLKQLRNLAGDGCLDMVVDVVGGDFVGQWELYMNEECTSADNQKFSVPLLWMPDSYLDDVRVFSDRSKCMDANPDGNYNVYMADCQAGNINQDFHYDSRTRQIKHRGLCLGWSSDGVNVRMAPCHQIGTQKWTYDNNRLIWEYNEFVLCLEWDEAENNLFVNTCAILHPSHQRFVIPTRWLPAIENADAGSSSEELQEDATYHIQSVPAGIWNGNWDEQKLTCSIDMLKDVLNTCDESMELLLGNVASLGILRRTATLIAEKNDPGRMPGKCCLDDPRDSEYFGYYYDASSMECQNRGPWHLGISAEACENANGRWFRSPCVTLQECIADRPKNTTDEYSPSFENFAQDLDIKDSSDEDECRSARAGLGFDRDYPFDTEVCEEFYDRMCDPFYDDLDSVTDDTDPTWEHVGYNKPNYPPDDELNKIELPDLESVEKVDDSGLKTAVNALQWGQQVTWSAFQTAVAIARKEKDLTKWSCDSLPSGLSGGFARSFCYAATFFVAFLLWFNEWVALTLWIATSYSYIGTNQQLTNYAKLNYGIIFEDRQWNFDALHVLNDNMHNQHTTVRQDLQDRHTSMEDHLTQYMACSTNYLGIEIILAIDANAIVEPLSSDCCQVLVLSNCNVGRRDLQEGNESDGPFHLNVTWPDNMRGLFSEMGGVKQRVLDISMGIQEIKQSIGKPQKRPKAQKSEKPENIIGAYNVFDAAEGTIGVMDESTTSDLKEDVIRELEGEMSAIEGKVDALDGKVNAISDMIAVLIDQNEKRDQEVHGALDLLSQHSDLPATTYATSTTSTDATIATVARTSAMSTSSTNSSDTTITTNTPTTESSAVGSTTVTFGATSTSNSTSVFEDESTGKPDDGSVGPKNIFGVAEEEDGAGDGSRNLWEMDQMEDVAAMKRSIGAMEAGMERMEANSRAVEGKVGAIESKVDALSNDVKQMKEDMMQVRELLMQMVETKALWRDDREDA